MQEDGELVSSVVVRRPGFRRSSHSMSDKPERFRGENFRRQRSQELKAGYPVPQFPEASRISIKTLGYLYAYCRLPPEEIAAKFPNPRHNEDILYAHLAEGFAG